VLYLCPDGCAIEYHSKLRYYFIAYIWKCCTIISLATTTTSTSTNTSSSSNSSISVVIEIRELGKIFGPKSDEIMRV
jgi:hypothetical protein